MMMKYYYRYVPLLFVVLAFPLAALAVHDLLASKQTNYHYHYMTSGGPREWPVWVEDLVFDCCYGVPAGVVGSESWDEPPRGGGSVIASPRPLPSTMHARWFSFRSQTFYEIDLELPDAWREQAQATYRQHRHDRRYRHHLLTGISGDGRVRLWWRTWCGPRCGEEPILIPIVEEAYGWQADGDPSHYQRRTQRRRDEGRIPPEPEPPPR